MLFAVAYGKNDLPVFYFNSCNRKIKTFAYILLYFSCRELRVLHLEQNEIWSIGRNQKVFCQLPKIEQILLGDNRLVDFDFRIDCLPELRYLDLERNMISRYDFVNCVIKFKVF